VIPATHQKTLKSYEEKRGLYIEKAPLAPEGSAKKWLDKALANLSLNARLYEIGSGDGADADYIESLGYDITCTDAAPSFVIHLLDKGFQAYVHNAILDPIIGCHDLILANAVLPHFTRDDAILVTSKVLAALDKKGRFAFTLKKGEGEGWTSSHLGAPRYYALWTRADLERILQNTGYARWDIEEAPGVMGSDERWLMVVAYKA